MSYRTEPECANPRNYLMRSGIRSYEAKIEQMNKATVTVRHACKHTIPVAALAPIHYGMQFEPECFTQLVKK